LRIVVMRNVVFAWQQSQTVASAVTSQPMVESSDPWLSRSARRAAARAAMWPELALSDLTMQTQSATENVEAQEPISSSATENLR
jgi:hypothetical protein